MVTISRETAIVSITGLRHFYKKLREDEKKYPFGSSSYASVLRFQKITIKAYRELQKVTGDKTPLSLPEGDS